MNVGRLIAAVMILTCTIAVGNEGNNVDEEDHEFADFVVEDEDEFESVEQVVGAETVEIPEKKITVDLPKQQKPPKSEETEEVADYMEEFDHFDDEDEFENYEKDEDSVPKGETLEKDKPIHFIQKLPYHQTATSYFLEIILVLCVFIYLLNFFWGTYKNADFVNMWYSIHLNLLMENFALVGDDSKPISVGTDDMKKECENIFTLWCSGRSCCEGMLVELKFLKRQDIVSMVINLFKKEQDMILFKFPLSHTDMDTYTMCIVSKKSANKYCKDCIDLTIFCPERKPGERFGLPSNFVVLSEIGEATTNFLDHRTLAAFQKYSDIIDSVHISDKYSGYKTAEESLNKQFESKRMLLVSLFIPELLDAEAVRRLYPVTVLILSWLERIRRFRLSKEGKAKAEKNRSRLEEVQMKTTHAARSEAAAARKEEKKRKEKERILNEEDPEKQKKLEEKEMKRQMKKKIPKMKQLKVKSL